MFLQLHPTWDIKDSSKLDAYQRCARYYFYRYILGWQMDMPAHDLLFGEGWHLSMEVMMSQGYDAVAEAYQAFIDSYREHFDPETDMIYKPKEPSGVLNALLRLQSDYKTDLIDNRVVELDGQKMLEISGKVPVDYEGRVLYYRLDSIMQQIESEKYFTWDFKTTSEKYLNGRMWADQFYLAIQNGTYTHCLFCLFPVDEVLGMEYYGVGFAHLSRGSANRGPGPHCTFRKVPAYKTPDQMNSWLWTVNTLLDEIDRDMSRLDFCSDNDSVLQAFRMNGTSCTDYRGCEFNDFCLAWQNPLQQCHTPPLGFKEEFWNPAERETKVKKDLEWGV